MAAVGHADLGVKDRGEGAFRDGPRLADRRDSRCHVAEGADGCWLTPDADRAIVKGLVPKLLEINGDQAARVNFAFPSGRATGHRPTGAVPSKRKGFPGGARVSPKRSITGW